MPTLVLDPPPPELVALRERRRQSGIDRLDEVWEGVLHMIPPPSAEQGRIASILHRVLGPLADASRVLTGAIGIGGDKNDYRVPDLALLEPGFAPQWNDTAALVVEIVAGATRLGRSLPSTPSTGSTRC